MDLAVLDSGESLDGVRDYWKRSQWHPNVHFEQFRLVCAERPEVVRPHVLVFGGLERPRSLLVARLERRRVPAKFGYLRAFDIPATVLTILYQGLSPTAGASEAEMLSRHLSGLLGSGHVDAVEASHVPAGSVLEGALADASRSPWSLHTSPGSEHWTATIPADGGLRRRMSSKHRRWHDRKDRELKEQFPSATWRWIQTPDDLSALCCQLEVVASRSYQRALGAGFRDDKEHRGRLALMVEDGLLRVQLLEIDGIVRAFWLGVVMNEVFYSSSTGYDPDLRQYEAGNLMFHRLADQLAQEGVVTLDFGLGDAFYKRRFGSGSRREGTMWLFAPSAKGRLLQAVITIGGTLDRVARSLLASWRMTDRIKTFWRRRLVLQRRRSQQGDRQ